jgi:hypothetical protein
MASWGLSDSLNIDSLQHPWLPWHDCGAILSDFHDTTSFGGCTRVQLGWIHLQFRNAVSNLTSMIDVLGIGTLRIAVNDLLSSIMKSEQIGWKGHVQWHVSMKNQCSRGTPKSPMNRRPQSMLHHCLCFIHWARSLFFILRRICCGTCVDNVCSCLMHAFADRVRLQVVGGGRNTLDSSHF